MNAEPRISPQNSKEWPQSRQTKNKRGWSNLISGQEHRRFQLSSQTVAPRGLGYRKLPGASPSLLSQWSKQCQYQGWHPEKWVPEYSILPAPLFPQMTEPCSGHSSFPCHGGSSRPPETPPSPGTCGWGLAGGCPSVDPSHGDWRDRREAMVLLELITESI